MAKKTKLSQVSTKPVPVKIVGTDSPKSNYVEEDKKWRAESALRTCKEYAKIKGDKSLMADVKKLADKERKELEAISKKY